MSKQIVVGLDIGTSAIRLVVCAAPEEGNRPRVLAQVKKESRGLKRGYLLNFEETLENLKAAVAEAERQARVKISKNVYLGIGGITLDTKTSDGQVAVSRSDLEITAYDVRRAAEASEKNLGHLPNLQILHNLPVGFRLDGKKIPGRPEGLTAEKLEMRTLFVYCLNQHLNDLLQVTRDAGLVVEEVVAAPLAASLACLSPNQKMIGCVLANIGSQTTSLVVYEENIIRSLKVFPIGSNDVTNDIALGLLISSDEAEKIKLDPDQVITQKKKLDLIIEARMSEIFELIEAHLKKLGLNALLPGGIIVVGGGANMPCAEELAKHTLKLPTKILDSNTVPQLKNQIRDASWTVAFGLCLSGLSDNAEEALGPRPLRGATKNIAKWLKELLP